MSNAPSTASPGPSVTRRGWVDAARGVAVLAMVIYHTAWDLGELQLIETDVARQPAFLLFARVIAASFLTLVGIGLVLAHADGVRARPFARRLAILVAAAGAVTAVTAIAVPQSFIFFGILHNIAFSSLVALPLVRVPALATVGLAVVMWTAPFVIEAPALDRPSLAFLGLGASVPNTNDYVPVFPWTGFVFAGIALAKLARPILQASAGPPGALGRVLARFGRHSLAIYLLHQPILFGLLWAVLQATGPNAVAQAAPFERACLASCGARGGSADLCRAGCACAIAAVRREGLWPAIQRARPSDEEAAKAANATRPCFTPLR